MRKNKIIFDAKKTFDEFKPDLDSSLQNTSKVAEVREITSPANVVSEDKKINVSTDEELTEKSERIHPVINTEIFQMIDEYVKTLSIAKEGITPISVDEIASRIARFYETIRKVVDWKEDNVLRRGAIVRILKRLLFTKVSRLSINKKVNPDDLAEVVTKELIRGGHLPNNEVPREKIPVVAMSIAKYLFFFDAISSSSLFKDNIKKQANFTTFLFEIAACEVEEILANPVKEYVLLETMTRIMEDLIKIIPSDGISSQEKRNQVFIACCRTLYDLDDAFIIYRLLEIEHPDWRNPKSEILSKRYEQIVTFWQTSDMILNHPQARNFKRACAQLKPIFTLLNDFLEEQKGNLSETLTNVENEDKFEEILGEIYDKRFLTLKRRLFRLGVFSTLSVFLSNWVTFFIVEVPLAKLFYEGFNLFTAFIDFLIPTAVMFVLVIIIRPPAKTNRRKVLEAVNSIVYQYGKKRYFEIRINKKSHSILKGTMMLLYLFMTWLVFTITAATFYFAGLPITSVVFDTFTIALTVFAAVIIRTRSKELSIDEKTTIHEFVLDMISVPIAKVGSFIAAKWKEYNVVEILFNYLVESPFVAIVDAIEEWSQFLKDRKAELH